MCDCVWRRQACMCQCEGKLIIVIGEVETEAWRGREEVTIRAQWDRRRACILEYLSDDMCGRGLAAAV
jgi:hypothetical protein